MNDVIKPVEFLPDLKLTGAISEIPSNAIRVSIRKPGISPNETYTDLFYNKDGGEIRCGTLNRGVFNLLFCVIGEQYVAVRDFRKSEPMDAETAAQFIMESMIEVIEAQA